MALSETLQTQLTQLLSEARRTARSAAASSAGRQSSTVATLLRQAIEAVPLPPLRHDTRLRLSASETERQLATAPPLGRLIGGPIETALRCAEPSASLDVAVNVDEHGSALSIRMATSFGSLSLAFLPLAMEELRRAFCSRLGRGPARPQRIGSLWRGRVHGAGRACSKLRDWRALDRASRALIELARHGFGAGRATTCWATPMRLARWPLTMRASHRHRWACRAQEWSSRSPPCRHRLRCWRCCQALQGSMRCRSLA